MTSHTFGEAVYFHTRLIGMKNVSTPRRAISTASKVAGEARDCLPGPRRERPHTHSGTLQLLLVTAVRLLPGQGMSQSLPPSPGSTNGVWRGSCSCELPTTLPCPLVPLLPPDLAPGSGGPCVRKPTQFQKAKTNVLAIENHSGCKSRQTPSSHFRAI